jgi:hypothetical protein
MMLDLLRELEIIIKKMIIIRNMHRNLEVMIRNMINNKLKEMMIILIMKNSMKKRREITKTKNSKITMIRLKCDKKYK